MGSSPLAIREHVPLAPFTTIGLGGNARWFVSCASVEEIAGALEHARERGVPIHILGGGSNTVFADAGFDGLVLRVATRGISAERDGGRTVMTVAAGEEWDPFVRSCVDRGFGGIECLSGIPGSVGATPIQNVGAYGQEVSESIVRVEAIDRSTLKSISFAGAECGFGYRMSRFKGEEAGRFVVTAVSFALTPDARPTLRYKELRAAVGTMADRASAGAPALLAVREAVLSLRRAKGMVADPADPHSRSCGSFFMNPILSAKEAAALQQRWWLYGGTEAVPTFIAGTDVKVSAAWLVEKSGFPKGTERNGVGVSGKHSLALVNHGGTTVDLLALAGEIEAAVQSRFGIRLQREPVVVP